MGRFFCLATVSSFLPVCTLEWSIATVSHCHFVIQRPTDLVTWWMLNAHFVDVKADCPSSLYLWESKKILPTSLSEYRHDNQEWCWWWWYHFLFLLCYLWHY